jgi:exopolysaccharide biosynthesis polyprenyl glycosylphosphotransferase
VNSAVARHLGRASTSSDAGSILARPNRDPRPAWIRAGLLVFDSVAALTFLSLMRYGGDHSIGTAGTWSANVGVAGAALASVLSLGAIGVYDPASRLPGARLHTGAQLGLLGCAGAVLTSLVAGGFGGTLNPHRLVIAALLLPVAWISARVAAACIERRHPARVLVVGTGSTARQVWELSERHHECAFRVVGFVDDEPLPLPSMAPATLGRLENLPSLVHEQGIDCVIVAYAKVVDADLLAVLRALDADVRVQVVPRLYELVQARGFELGRISVLQAGGASHGPSERCVKRVFDLVGASLLLALLTPMMVAIATAIKLGDGGPVFFRQRRVGRGGRVFGMCKFRTMAAGAEEHGLELIQGLGIEEAVRELKVRSVEFHATRVGRHLRAFSLDELPQLWNVLRGDMSLVGPRPMPEYEARSLHDLQAAARHSVRPGITGLWQVSGRSTISWEERVHLDCFYARHWSVTTDLRLLMRTVGVVVHRSDSV